MHIVSSFDGTIKRLSTYSQRPFNVDQFIIALTTVYMHYIHSPVLNDLSLWHVAFLQRVIVRNAEDVNNR